MPIRGRPPRKIELAWLDMHFESNTEKYAPSYPLNLLVAISQWGILITRF